MQVLFFTCRLIRKSRLPCTEPAAEKARILTTRFFRASAFLTIFATVFCHWITRSSNRLLPFNGDLGKSTLADLIDGCATHRNLQRGVFKLLAIDLDRTLLHHTHRL